jgi:hypothetical protein
MADAEEAENEAAASWAVLNLGTAVGAEDGVGGGMNVDVGVAVGGDVGVQVGVGEGVVVGDGVSVGVFVGLAVAVGEEGGVVASAHPLITRGISRASHPAHVQGARLDDDRRQANSAIIHRPPVMECSPVLGWASGQYYTTSPAHCRTNEVKALLETLIEEEREGIGSLSRRIRRLGSEVQPMQCRPKPASVDGGRWGNLRRFRERGTTSLAEIGILPSN